MLHMRIVVMFYQAANACMTMNRNGIEGEDGSVPQLFITGRSKVVILLWFYAACIDVRAGDVYMIFRSYVQIIKLGSVKCTEFSPFGKELLTRLTFFWERAAHSVNLLLERSCSNG